MEIWYFRILIAARILKIFSKKRKKEADFSRLMEFAEKNDAEHILDYYDYCEKRRKKK